jgi:hypothetical protein
VNESLDVVKTSITHPKYKEQSVQLEILDLPLVTGKAVLAQGSNQKLSANQMNKQKVNEYEINMVYALANTENTNIFAQKSVRAFIDFVWPKTRALIIKDLFLPYLAFILYYIVYLVVLKKLNTT